MKVFLILLMVLIDLLELKLLLTIEKILIVGI